MSYIVNWYLKEIKTVQELTNKKLFVEKVIDRLVHHVSYCHVTNVHIPLCRIMYYCHW